MQVVKRNGSIVDFDQQKIENAVSKANHEVHAKERATKKEISEIIEYIKSLDKNRMLVEDIQDIIEEKLMEDPMGNLSGAWSGTPYTVKADQWLEDGQEEILAGFSVTVLHTPGHTSGSCCYWLKEEGVCMSGDTVFCGSCGRTDLPTGSMSQMRDSLHRLFEILPEETQIFPGHGEETDAAFEKAHNPYL